MLTSIIVLAGIGIVLSFYAWNVEQHVGRKKGYHAACDINEEVSCTRAFTSSYGRLLGASNSFYGMVFYALIILLALRQETGYILVLSILVLLASICLAYLQYVKVNTLCLVCNAIYVVNILLAIVSYRAAF